MSDHHEGVVRHPGGPASGNPGFMRPAGKWIPALAVARHSGMTGVSGWALISDHPETMIYCEQPSNTIFAPLDVVIWNDQTPPSSSAKLAPDNYSRYDPISGWALISLFSS